MAREIRYVIDETDDGETPMVKVGQRWRHFWGSVATVSQLRGPWAYTFGAEFIPLAEDGRPWFPEHWTYIDDGEPAPQPERPKAQVGQVWSSHAQGLTLTIEKFSDPTTAICRTQRGGVALLGITDDGSPSRFWELVDPGPQAEKLEAANALLKELYSDERIENWLFPPKPIDYAALNHIGEAFEALGRAVYACTPAGQDEKSEPVETGPGIAALSCKAPMGPWMARRSARRPGR